HQITHWRTIYMNKNDEQQFLPAAVQQTDTDSVVGLHPQIIVVVGTIEASLHNESTGGMRKIECISELTNERFEIIALADNNAVGGRSKAGFFRRTSRKAVRRLASSILQCM
ncbi:hypothetical protein, partial [Paenibacillus thailandensis]